MIKERPEPATTVDQRPGSTPGHPSRGASSDFVQHARLTAFVVLLTVLFLIGTSVVGLLLMGDI